MRKSVAKKIGLEMDARLYAELSKLAKENGQSRKFLLEKAVEHYLSVVVPAQGTVRLGVRAHFGRSAEKYRKLLGLLTK